MRDARAVHVGIANPRWRKNVPRIPGACATRNFTYLARGTWPSFTIPQVCQKIQMISTSCIITQEICTAFYLYVITLILAWMSNYIHYQVWNEITFPFPNAAAVEVCKWIYNFTPHSMGRCLFILAGINPPPPPPPPPPVYWTNINIPPYTILYPKKIAHNCKLHFCYLVVHSKIWDRCIVGFMDKVYWIGNGKIVQKPVKQV